MELGGVFVGWIRKAEIPIISPLLVENSLLGGVITTRRSHLWAGVGGGLNYSGTVVIT
jgi:hypothetical protein